MCKMIMKNQDRLRSMIIKKGSFTESELEEEWYKQEFEDRFIGSDTVSDYLDWCLDMGFLKRDGLSAPYVVNFE